MWAKVSKVTTRGSKIDWTEVSIKYIIESAIDHNEKRKLGESISQNPDGNIKEESCGNSSSRHKLQRTDSLNCKWSFLLEANSIWTTIIRKISKRGRKSSIFWGRY